MVEAGAELFVTDGTVTGTHIVEDLNPGDNHGVNTAAYYNPTLSGGYVYVRATDGVSGTELYRFDPGATAQSVGRSCGPSKTTLWCSDPALGGTTTFVGRGAPNPGQGLLILGSGPSVPVAHCFGYVTKYALLLGVPGADWRAQFTNPTNKNLAGLRIVAQTIYFSAAAPRGFELSNAVYLTVGR